MTATPSFSANVISYRMWQQIQRIGPLSAIVLLHVMFFYALESGLLKQTTHATPRDMPREMFVSLISAKPVPEPEKPKPPALVPVPKTVPAVKKPVKHTAPVKPAIKPATKPISLPEPVETPQIAAAAPSIESPAAAPAAAPAPTAPAVPKSVSGVEYIQAPPPEYPTISRRMGEEGKVVLRVLVNEKGRPEGIDVRQSSGSARLDEAARKAASRWLFKPHLEDGKAVAVYALVPINFSIQ